MAKIGRDESESSGSTDMERRPAFDESLFSFSVVEDKNPNQLPGRVSRRIQTHSLGISTH